MLASSDVLHVHSLHIRNMWLRYARMFCAGHNHIYSPCLRRSSRSSPGATDPKSLHLTFTKSLQALPACSHQHNGLHFQACTNTERRSSRTIRLHPCATGLASCATESNAMPSLLSRQCGAILVSCYLDALDALRRIELGSELGELRQCLVLVPCCMNARFVLTEWSMNTALI